MKNHSVWSFFMLKTKYFGVLDNLLCKIILLRNFRLISLNITRPSYYRDVTIYRKVDGINVFNYCIIALQDVV